MTTSSEPADPPKMPSLDDSHISCPVCWEIFHTPKSLHCGHSVCKSCCTRILQKSDEKAISCPECRQATVVPEGGGLPTNYVLQKLIAAMGKQNDDGKKRFRCIDCDRSYDDTDKIWISYDKNDILQSLRNAKLSMRCQACYIDNYSNLPESMMALDKVFDNVGEACLEIKEIAESHPAGGVEWENNIRKAMLDVQVQLVDIASIGQLLEEFLAEDILIIMNDVDESKKLVDFMEKPESIDQLIKNMEAMLSVQEFDQEANGVLKEINELSNALERLVKQGEVVQAENSRLKSLELAKKLRQLIKIKPDPPAVVNVCHTTVTCDGCEKSPIVGIRFKCLICGDYDLCSECEGKRVHDDHPMIRIVKADYASWTRAFVAAQNPD